MATHESTRQARERVLKVAKRRGYITNKQACIIGGWKQGYYHLRIMVRAGLLKQDGFNQWVPSGK